MQFKRSNIRRRKTAVVLFAIYLVLVIAVPIALSSAVGFGSLPRGTTCPNCAQDTLLLLSPALRVAQLAHCGTSLQHRWCPSCAWDGYARTVNVQIARTSSLKRTRPLRTLELGGKNWNVLLEYWQESGHAFGRLMFVAPSGKQWYDPMAAFSGDSSGEVLEQARALSDRILTYRLREVISD